MHSGLWKVSGGTGKTVAGSRESENSVGHPFHPLPDSPLSPNSRCSKLSHCTQKRGHNGISRLELETQDTPCQTINAESGCTNLNLQWGLLTAY